ncbi:hypothetical protein ST37_19190 [Vibrio sp. qd031]|nr:hypothetical protein ST37_19190 [Vibrio sp. qd031]
MKSLRCREQVQGKPKLIPIGVTNWSENCAEQIADNEQECSDNCFGWYQCIKKPAHEERAKRLSIGALYAP